MARFVYFYTHLDEPFEAAAARLEGDPAGWLPPPADPQEDGYLVDLNADGALPAGLDHIPACVELGPATLDGDRLYRLVRWRAAIATQRLFPTLSGELELQRLAGHGSRLCLNGTYQPPGWRLGELADRLAGHRLAEACVRRFVLDVAERATAQPTAS